MLTWYHPQYIYRRAYILYLKAWIINALLWPLCSHKLADVSRMILRRAITWMRGAPQIHSWPHLSSAAPSPSLSEITVWIWPEWTSARRAPLSPSLSPSLSPTLSPRVHRVDCHRHRNQRRSLEWDFEMFTQSGNVLFGILGLRFLDLLHWNEMRKLGHWI